MYKKNESETGKQYGKSCDDCVTGPFFCSNCVDYSHWKSFLVECNTCASHTSDARCREIRRCNNHFYWEPVGEQTTPTTFKVPY